MYLEPYAVNNPRKLYKISVFTEIQNIPESPRLFRGYPRGYPLPGGSKYPRNGDKSPKVATMIKTEIYYHFRGLLTAYGSKYIN